MYINRSRITFLLTIIMISFMVVFSCSDNNPAESNNSTNTPQPPGDYPPIPEPANALNLDLPDTSEIYTLIVPIADKNVDFVPTVSDGRFAWDVDIQTQYTQTCVFGCPNGVTTLYLSDPPGDYYNGVRMWSNMLFEGGIVNLTSLDEFQTLSLDRDNSNTNTMRVIFAENGEIVQPRNPYRNDCWYDWWGDTFTDKRVTPCLFAGEFVLPVEPGFFDDAKWRRYYVAAKSCNPITAPIYIKRERFWINVPVDGKDAIKVDPGTSFEITYQKVTGVSVTESEQFAQTLDLNVGATVKAITGSIGTTLTETFSTTVEVTEQETSTSTRSVTGTEGKTRIYSVWRSVERYTITDSLGNPYTDPVFEFSELGETSIQGEFEWLASTTFDL